MSANEEAINNIKSIVKSNIESRFDTMLNQAIYLNKETLVEINNGLKLINYGDAVSTPMPLTILPATHENIRNRISYLWASTITLALAGYYSDTKESLEDLTNNLLAVLFFICYSPPPFILLYAYVISDLLVKVYNSLFIESHDLRTSVRSVGKSWNERTSLIRLLAENSNLLKILSRLLYYTPSRAKPNHLLIFKR